MSTNPFSLDEVLAVAKIHPLYNPNLLYPPSPEEIQATVQAQSSTDSGISTLESWPLTTKKDLYKVIERLTKDTNTQNEYRRSSYVSVTGGGSGDMHLMFFTDVKENRQHRAAFGEFLRTCGVVEPHDWILTTHTSGYLYRSLDLLTEILENAGGTILSAGNLMKPSEVVRALARYNVNVLTGDSSQVIQVIHHISTLSADERNVIKLTKVIYTSEPLTDTQKRYIYAILGPAVKTYSILGSAEAGPYAIHNPDLTGEASSYQDMSIDFVFDTRSILVEIFPRSIMESDTPSSDLKLLPEGEEGVIVQTSLQRRRNPLVRYITGDLGSVHPVPKIARSIVPESEMEYYRVLRLRGRDRRFSFKWYGEYFEFSNIEMFMQKETFGILQWQVIVGTLDSSPQTTLEIRMLRAAASDDMISLEQYVYEVERFFFVLPDNRHLFKLTFVEDIRGFEKSGTGNKVMKFVDRRR
ncbi:hypothetical protein BO85DRAFT_521328 [Aspergillus piperis CBS 112811]|uniref:Uncharacterized protein n=1 Tax=Aspergillus piperis CBS 112811 TaxID=1448313 RepID=A0A8G1QY40_9EURO|nr:hypothetical protein BO85DRAFT_521328 [Aspergillus piperis CBS 112811]RAH56038.1 hypothetical protein BO85DRAFT_521328 [Aspergillus piperis CBS 112811]